MECTSTSLAKLSSSTILAAILLVDAAALCIVLFPGLVRRSVGPNPRCAACGYSLYGSPAETTQCPECGAELDVVATRRLRWRLLVWTVVVTVFVFASYRLLARTVLPGTQYVGQFVSYSPYPSDQYLSVIVKAVGSRWTSPLEQMPAWGASWRELTIEIVPFSSEAVTIHIDPQTRLCSYADDQDRVETGEHFDYPFMVSAYEKAGIDTTPSNVRKEVEYVAMIVLSTLDGCRPDWMYDRFEATYLVPTWGEINRPIWYSIVAMLALLGAWVLGAILIRGQEKRARHRSGPKTQSSVPSNRIV